MYANGDANVIHMYIHIYVHTYLIWALLIMPKAYSNFAFSLTVR